ncbi:hypothetical protein O6H91_15G042500 [Diphasiastrum complanatum]|uniref:Uncharacterized protein n=1 Tax=Diphasiastrum complanatum TaxID=34168 RepID=A0ACC2BHM8_DIPCM|nr:hypothetical protein O6H91_15G042500 [Diphasiastrum complanatum]
MAWKLGLILLILSAWALAGSADATAISGISSWFNEYKYTVCYGTNQTPFLPGPRIVALNPKAFSLAACGQCLNVTCTGGLSVGDNPCKANTPGVVVKIVDNCGESSCNDLNLSKYAFAQIANVNAGDIKVSYQSALCQ